MVIAQLRTWHRAPVGIDWLITIGLPSTRIRRVMPKPASIVFSARAIPSARAIDERRHLGVE
jgi:hypothetical protein